MHAPSQRPSSSSSMLRSVSASLWLHWSFQTLSKTLFNRICDRTQKNARSSALHGRCSAFQNTSAHQGFLLSGCVDVGVLCVLLDEFPPQFHIVSHEDREKLVGFLRVIDPYPSQTTGLGVHG